MITLTLPPNEAPYKRVTLNSGTTYRPRFHKDGASITVDDEADAQQLEREGWRRDGASKRAANFQSAMLAKAAAAQLRHTDGSAAHPRTEFGDVAVVGSNGESQRVMVAHDQGADVVSVHGVNFELGDIDPDLRAAFRVASSAFGEAQDSAEQTDARALVGVVVDSILRRHDFIGARVRERQHHQRYAAV